MMETDPDAVISLDPTVHCILLTKSPIQTALSVRESRADSSYCRLCEGNAAEASLGLCKWKSWRHGSGLCQSDGVHRLTIKQTLHSSNKRGS